ncbi:MAG TPA: DUF5715 family protein, partial [Blastocatellia bacterium]|nr:DUF5715 family protein [Blastocatellia bacterium]
AVQIADTRKQQFKLPHDFVELIDLIQSGQMVEVEPVGKDYILYGVGANASDEIFSHYDQQSGNNIPLFSDFKDFEEEYKRLEDSATKIEARIADLGSELRKTQRRDRQRRRTIQARIGEDRRSLGAVKKEMAVLASFYRDARKRKLIDREQITLKEFASDFTGQTYDLEDPASRQKLKVRLLSFLRPEAREVLFEIARSYSEQFARPLPVTSLVRPEQYQRQLGETNPNATRAAIPPHSTGMAFDVFYYYMTASEQDFLMSEVAKLEEEGRVEALRENRNHIHIFAFADGKLPEESLIADSMTMLGSKRAAVKASPASKKQRAAATGPALARAGKKRARAGDGAN